MRRCRLRTAVWFQRQSSPHVHVLVLDGVYAGLEGETPRFYPLRAPDDPDVAAVAETVSRRAQTLCMKNRIGTSYDCEAEDPLMRDTPWLAGLYAHGVGASPRGRTPGSVSPPGVAAENPKSRNHPRDVAPMSMDSVFMQISAFRHIGDRSWKIFAGICCGLH